MTIARTLFMKREQRPDAPAGEGPIGEIGALRAALRLQPPARELQLDRLERLRPYALAPAVRAGNDPPAIFESVDSDLLISASRSKP